MVRALSAAHLEDGVPCPNGIWFCKADYAELSKKPTPPFNAPTLHLATGPDDDDWMASAFGQALPSIEDLISWHMEGHYFHDASMGIGTNFEDVTRLSLTLRAEKTLQRTLYVCTNADVNVSFGTQIRNGTVDGEEDALQPENELNWTKFEAWNGCHWCANAVRQSDGRYWYKGQVIIDSDQVGGFVNLKVEKPKGNLAVWLLYE